MMFVTTPPPLDDSTIASAFSTLMNMTIREEQWACARAMAASVENNTRNALSIAEMPTGGGKSLSIVLAALLQIRTNSTDFVHVVSPTADLAKAFRAFRKIFEYFKIPAKVLVDIDTTSEAQLSRWRVIFSTVADLSMMALSGKASGVYVASPSLPPKSVSLIVDEVDHELIDTCASSCLLQSATYGTEFLLPLQMLIATTASAMERQLRESHRVAAAVSGNSTSSAEMSPPSCAAMTAAILTNVIEAVREAINNNEIAIPAHLKPVAWTRVPTLAFSFFSSGSVTTDVDVVNYGPGMVRPLCSGTGMVGSNQVLSDGVQQYISIRNGHALIPEGFVGASMTTQAFFSQYTFVSGCTGTAGGAAGLDLMRTVAGRGSAFRWRPSKNRPACSLTASRRMRIASLALPPPALSSSSSTPSSRQTLSSWL